MNRRRYVINVRCNPPTSTASAHQRIMKRKDGSHFIGKASGGKSQQAKDTLIGLLMPHQIPTALEGPVGVSVVWTYPWRKSERKKVKAKGKAYHTSARPDLDNLNKLLLDVMTGLGFWRDDGQVAVLACRKFWGDNPGIFLDIVDLSE